jgi:hypothetical protein
LQEAVLSATGFTVAVGLGVALGAVAAAGLAIAMPLFQTNFFPDLTHVNLVVAVEEVAPAFVQGAPAFTAACEIGVRPRNENAIRTTTARFRM